VNEKVKDVTIPGEPRPTGSGAIRTLTIIASALTAASIVINLILQIAHFMKKRPVGPDQRDRLDTAALTLSVLRQMPGVVRQVRLLASQLRQA
jgi:hypothetical protein